MILPGDLPSSAEDRIDVLRHAKRLMVDYLSLKVVEEDWHGCADAAMDLRDIENEIKGIEFMRGLKSVPSASA